MRKTGCHDGVILPSKGSPVGASMRPNFGRPSTVGKDSNQDLTKPIAPFKIEDLTTVQIVLRIDVDIDTAIWRILMYV